MKLSNLGSRARGHASTGASAVVVIGLVGLLYLHFKGEGAWVGKPAPDFSLPVAFGAGAEAGDRIRLSDLKGQFVVLDFWASWCEPCRQSVPLLDQVAKDLAPDGVRVFGINSEGLTPDRVRAVAEGWGFVYPVLHDATAETMLGYDVRVLPTLFLVDRKGIVRRTYGGAPTAERIIAEVRELNRKYGP